ncbi:MAG: DUF1565 domain-containing protein [bacterium]
MKKYFLIVWLLTLCNSSFSQVVKFAALGDLGGYTLFPNEYGDLQVSNLVKSWDTDTSFFIITLGDNNYFPSSQGEVTIDYNIGQFYHQYIYPYNIHGFTPGYGPNPQTKNRFFRGLGNHDLYGSPAYADFFYFEFSNINKGNSNAYPGGIRYYDFQKGNVHFFSFNTGTDPSDHTGINFYSEPDGIDTSSIQGHWLKQRMLQSTAKWKIVYFHHPPYYSHDILPQNTFGILRFPFKQWGANVVLNAHWHQYERLNIDGIPYVINGLGGATHTSMNSLPQARQGSQALYSEAYGALQGMAYADSLVFKLFNVDNQLIDYFKIKDTTDHYKGPWYVNDNSINGDIYTSAIGNDGSVGSLTAPFQTINRAVSSANAGDTIYVDAGTYGQNVVVDKRLTIIGAGNTTIVNPPTGACFQYTAGGTRSILRQQLKKIHLTGSGEGILVSTPNLQYLSFNNVKSDNHTGNGINFNSSWTISRPIDIKVDSCDLSHNANAGLKLASNSNLNGLSITAGNIDSNGVQGFLSGVNSSAGVTNISINGTSFTGNGSSEIGNQGDIIFLGFNGNADISNVNINSDAGYGIKFQSNTTLSAAGNINLNNINITGTDKNKIGLGFVNYADLNSLSMNNNNINTNPSPTFTGFAIGVDIDTIGSSVILSGIRFGNTHLGNGAGIDIELAGTNNVFASGVTFSTTNNFIIEDRIHHGVDVTGKGLVIWAPGNLFVTTNSFYLLSTSEASIQRVINVAPNGFTINLGDGTYNEDININKTLELKGQSTNAIIRGLYAGDSNTVLITANDVNIKNVTVTRNYGTTISDWASSTKIQGINMEPQTVGTVIQNVTLTGNHNAILAIDPIHMTITSCRIENNYAGICFGNNLSETEVHNNFIRNNFTHGILFNYDLIPGIVATSVNITDNSITGNWYSQINFQRNSAPALTGVDSNFTFSCNWYGVSVPAVVAANAAEPDYTSLAPSQFGGTDPGLNRQLYGIEIGRCAYIPWLTSGTDNDTVAAGFQPTPDSCNGEILLTRLYVNDSSLIGDRYTGAIGSDFNEGTSAAPFATITHAIALAKISDTLYVDAGTYVEQVNIDKSITIIGNDSANFYNSIIKAPSILNPVSNANGNNFRPVVYISGANNIVDISHIFVDGDGRGGDKFLGIYYFEAGGTFSHSKIRNIRDSSFGSEQSGDAFFANHTHNTNLNQKLIISNNVIEDYQNTGILISDINTEGVVTNNIVTGQNTRHVNGEKGIQFGDGAYGTITGNTITNNLYNGPSPGNASGILLAGAGVDQTNTPTGYTTTIGGIDTLSNTLNGNEIGLLADSGSSGYYSNQGVINNGNTFSNNYIHFSEISLGTIPSALNIYDKRVDNKSFTNIVYGIIQRAVDEANATDTLNVSAGTFAENVMLSKSLILKGSKAGVDARGRVSGAPDPILETVISPATGAALELLSGSSSSMIDGFTMLGDVGDTNGIIETISSVLDNIQLKNTYIKVTSANGHAIWFNMGITDVTLDKNEFVGGSASAHVIFLNGNQSFAGMHLTNNNVLGSGGTYGLFVDGNRNVGTSITSRSPLFQGNLFQGFLKGMNAGSRSLENVRFFENTFSNNSELGFEGGPKDCDFARNTFTGNGLFGMSLTSFGNTDTLSGAIGTIVQNNFFSENATATGGLGDILLGDQNDGTQNTNIITNNSFESVITIYNEEQNGNSDTIHAPCNWYNTVSDASVSTKLFSVAGGKVNFIPWLTSGTDFDTITKGFQPVPGMCNGAPITALNIKVIPEGFYDITTQRLTITDTVTAFLHSVNPPYSQVDSAVSTIDSVTFNGSFQFSHLNGIYYIVIKHRNSIETWSKMGGEDFTAGTITNYDFTDSASKAYQNNMKQVDTLPSRFAIYSGDVNQDGVTDITDGSIIDNDYFNFVTGYVVTDLNADGIVDITDAAIQVNNSFSFVAVQRP